MNAKLFPDASPASIVEAIDAGEESGKGVPEGGTETAQALVPRHASEPPSTVYTAPVTNEDASEARKQATLATSSAWPERLTRWEAIMNFSTASLSSAASRKPCRIGVSMEPGAKQLTRISGDRSTAAARVTWIRPPLLAQYAAPIGYPVRPDTDEQFTMAGPLPLR